MLLLLFRRAVEQGFRYTVAILLPLPLLAIPPFRLYHGDPQATAAHRAISPHPTSPPPAIAHSSQYVYLPTPRPPPAREGT